MKKNSSNLNYLSDYQTFTSVQELNYHVKQHTNQRYNEMNETQRNVLQVLAQYSVKYLGASHLKVETIAGIVGKSRRTVERALKALEELSVIQKLSTIRRVSGGQGANIYVILPYVEGKMSKRDEDDKPRDSKDCTPIVKKETASNISYPSNYILETAKAVKNAIPAVIYDTLSPFFNAKDLQRITGVIFRAKTAKVRLETHKDAFTSLFLDVIRRYKQGGITSLDGYIYASVRRLSRRLYLAC